MAKVSRDDMRNANMISLLRCIRDHAPISKNGIKDITGLSWGTISNMTAELVRHNILRENVHSNSPHLGRTPASLTLNPNSYCAIGIELNIGGISILLMNLNLEIEYSVHEDIRSTDRSAVLAQAFEMTDRLINSLDDRRPYLLGIGIAMQGIVDSEKGISRYSPYFKNWSNIDLKMLFEERYRVSVSLEHSPNCQAQYEKQLGVGKGYKDMAYIRLSTSIGMSILFNDTIWRGADGNAGEFGHVTAVPNGRRCACGKNGCLETVASAAGMLEMVRDYLRQGGESLLTSEFGVTDPERIDFEQVYGAASAGDAYCVRLFQDMGRYLGTAIGALICIVNPAVIIIGGGLAHYEDMFYEPMMEAIHKNAWAQSNCNIIFSKSRQNTATIGAALYVTNRFFDGEFTHIVNQEETK